MTSCANLGVFLSGGHLRPSGQDMCAPSRSGERAEKKRSGANPQPEGFPFGSPHRRCDEKKKKDDFWTRRVEIPPEGWTRRVETSRGAERRARKRKNSHTRSVHPKGENSRTRRVHEKNNRTLRPARARDRVKIAHTCTRTHARAHMRTRAHIMRTRAFKCARHPSGASAHTRMHPKGACTTERSEVSPHRRCGLRAGERSGPCATKKRKTKRERMHPKGASVQHACARRVHACPHPSGAV